MSEKVTISSENQYFLFAFDVVNELKFIDKKSVNTIIFLTI